MKYGVPQGSILVLLLFIIDINDTIQVSIFTKIKLHADNANIIITGNNIGEINVQQCDFIKELVKRVGRLGRW